MKSRSKPKRATTGSGFCAPIPSTMLRRSLTSTRRSGRSRDIIRTTKSIMDTRPIYHRCNEIIRGHVFCSFLALLLKTELERRMEFADLKCEWAQVIRDLEAFATGRGDFSGEKLCSTEPDYQRGLQHLKNVS